MISTDVSAALADFLTHLNSQDPAFIKELVNQRAYVTNEDLDVVCPAERDPMQAGVIGVLNGFLDSIGQPRIAFVEQDSGEITGFLPLRSTWNVIEVNGVIIEVAGDVPDDEVARLKGLLEDKLTTTLVTNYRARITRLPEGCDLLLVCADGAPTEELEVLHSRINEAKEDPDYSIVTNYEVNITGGWNAKP